MRPTTAAASSNTHSVLTHSQRPHSLTPSHVAPAATAGSKLYARPTVQHAQWALPTVIIPEELRAQEARVDERGHLGARVLAGAAVHARARVRPPRTWRRGPQGLTCAAMGLMKSGIAAAHTGDEATAACSKHARSRIVTLTRACNPSCSCSLCHRDEEHAHCTSLLLPRVPAAIRAIHICSHPPLAHSAQVQHRTPWTPWRHANQPCCSRCEGAVRRVRGRPARKPCRKDGECQGA